MLKHLPSDSLKAVAKIFLYDRQPVYYSDTGIDRRNHNGNNIDLTGLNKAGIFKKKLPTLKI